MSHSHRSPTQAKIKTNGIFSRKKKSKMATLKEVVGTRKKRKPRRKKRG